jgi:putative membrane protein insertion efficiency factor
MIRRLALLLIHWYQRFLSPLKRPTCRFLPTCSEYAYEAISRFGVWRGGRMAAWRLLRCQPLCAGGYDPVLPEAPACHHHDAPEEANP